MYCKIIHHSYKIYFAYLMFLYLSLECKLHFYLNNAIPACRNDDGIRVIGRKAYAANPIRMPVILYGVFTFGQGVP